MRPVSNSTKLSVMALLLFLTAGAVQGQYTEYKEISNRKLLFDLVFNKDSFGYSLSSGGEENRFLFSLTAVDVRGSAVLADGKTLIDSDGLHVGDQTFRFEDVTDIEVKRRVGLTTVSFYTRDESSERTGRIRRGNIIEPFRNIVVDEKEFIRGSVFSVTGDIEIDGEVNKDVISLFGNVSVGPDAVVRGDVVTVKGRVELAGNASVYGEVRAESDTRLGRRHRYSRFRSTYGNYFNLDVDSAMTQYNRVDGLSVGLTGRFADPDSLLPTAWAGGGYAFESARWRYRLGLEQTILRRPALAVGGETFRRLATDDEWLISNMENSVFAMVIGEDYRDYYESEGARAYLRTRPFDGLRIETGFHFEETKWLDAERDLWSIFGGDKKFKSNFWQVDSLQRAQGIAAIDTGRNYEIYARMSYDTRDKDDPYYYSAWAVDGLIERSSPGLDSDFDYTRYRLSAARYQKIHRRIMAIVRGVYGGSDGLLPMHRRFYLGGLGTMYGYEQKEFSGSYFWLGNLEYRVDFPHSDLAASLMWDVGQISETSDFKNAEVKHSLGVALYVGNDFKIGLAKRLDRSFDDKPNLFARLTFAM